LNFEIHVNVIWIDGFHVLWKSPSKVCKGCYTRILELIIILFLNQRKKFTVWRLCVIPDLQPFASTPLPQGMSIVNSISFKLVKLKT